MSQCNKSSAPRQSRDSPPLLSLPDAPALAPLLFPSSWPEVGKAGVVDNYWLVIFQKYSWALGFLPTEVTQDHPPPGNIQPQVTQHTNSEICNTLIKPYLRPLLLSWLHIFLPLKSKNIFINTQRQGQASPFPWSGSVTRATDGLPVPMATARRADPGWLSRQQGQLPGAEWQLRCATEVLPRLISRSHLQPGEIKWTGLWAGITVEHKVMAQNWGFKSHHYSPTHAKAGATPGRLQVLWEETSLKWQHPEMICSVVQLHQVAIKL